MEIENSFTVNAPPDTVYGFLLDVNRVVGCVPGAELSEVVDADTFKGKVRIKVGPVTVSYNGTARITERDQAARTARLRAEGKETTGSGSAQATTTMSVREEGAASLVTFTTDFTVVGRIAQFGRGIMEDVSRHLVGQMAECIRTTLEAEAPEQPRDTSAPDGGMSTGPVVQETPQPTSAPAALDAVALGRAVARERISRAGRGPQIAGLALGAFLLLLFLRRLRRRRD